MVEAGFSPQLTLTAAILAAGGFEGLGTPTPGELTYLRGHRPQARRPRGGPRRRPATRAPTAADQALDGPEPADRPLRRSRRAPTFAHRAAVRARLRRRLRPPGPGVRMVDQRRGRRMSRATRCADPQRIAADPALSAFVTANAGSGKTKTLIDRVARLLLARGQARRRSSASPTPRPPPPRCSAACSTCWAAGRCWTTRRCATSWPTCRAASRRLRRADLSARPRPVRPALETPGGLKIQTIHAFCEKLLRRFPLEAGVSPGFQVHGRRGRRRRRRRPRATLSPTRALAGDGADRATPMPACRWRSTSPASKSMFAAFEARRGAPRRLLRALRRAGRRRRPTSGRACGFDAPATGRGRIGARPWPRLDRRAAGATPPRCWPGHGDRPASAPAS